MNDLRILPPPVGEVGLETRKNPFFPSPLNHLPEMNLFREAALLPSAVARTFRRVGLDRNAGRLIIAVALGNFGANGLTTSVLGMVPTTYLHFFEEPSIGINFKRLARAPFDTLASSWKQSNDVAWTFMINTDLAIAVPSTHSAGSDGSVGIVGPLSGTHNKAILRLATTNRPR
jgi:hypothetical protein